MNPIEQEVVKLANSWDEFLVSERRIAHWLINPADQSLVNAFVKLTSSLMKNGYLVYSADEPV